MTAEGKSDLHGSHLDELELDALRNGEGSTAARRHLGECRRCRDRLAVMEGVAADLRTAHHQPAPPGPEAERRILENLVNSRTSSGDTERSARVPVLALTAAAAALALIFLFSGKGEPPESTAPVATEASRGDLNNDQVVDDRDLEELKNLIAQGADAPPAWDLSGDGRIDDDDVRILDDLIAATEDLSEDKVGC